MYSHNARFCLICNDKNKIDLALQSRCTKFRFKPFSSETIHRVLKKICLAESVDYDYKSIDTLISVNNGDIRKCINILQSVYMTYKKVNTDGILTCLGLCKTNDIINIYEMLTNKKSFESTYEFIKNLIDRHNISLNNIINEISLLVINDKFNMHSKYFILDRLAHIQYNMSVSLSADIYVASFISVFFLHTHKDNIFVIDLI
jgi:DNA polymerase III delta prime subunit